MQVYSCGIFKKGFLKTIKEEEDGKNYKNIQ